MALVQTRRIANHNSHNEQRQESLNRMANNSASQSIKVHHRVLPLQRRLDPLCPDAFFRLHPYLMLRVHIFSSWLVCMLRMNAFHPNCCPFASSSPSSLSCGQCHCERHLASVIWFSSEWTRDYGFPECWYWASGLSLRGWFGWCGWCLGCDADYWEWPSPPQAASAGRCPPPTRCGSRTNRFSWVAGRRCAGFVWGWLGLCCSLDRAWLTDANDFRRDHLDGGADIFHVMVLPRDII